MTNNGNTLKYRVRRLEKQCDQIDDKVDKIMTNHLPHINEDLIAIKTRVNILFAVNMGAIITAVILGKLL